MRLDHHTPIGTVCGSFLFFKLFFFACSPAPLLAAPGPVGVAAAKVNTPFAKTLSVHNPEGVVLVLPHAINGDKRFSRLVLHNAGPNRSVVTLVAHSRCGKREERIVNLTPGGVRRPIVATLFPRLHDFTLQLLARGDGVTMALENWPAVSGGGTTEAIAFHGEWDPAVWTAQVAGFKLP